MDTKLIKKLTLPSLVIWLVPFLVSFVFYDQSGSMVGEYWVFKVTMIIAATVAAWFMLRTFFKDNPHVTVLQASIVILLFQVLLDILVLIGLLKMPAGIYFATVLPVYLVIIPVTNYVLSRMQRKNTAK